MDLREVGYDGRNWINLAQDRDRRRAYFSKVSTVPRWYTTFVIKPQKEVNGRQVGWPGKGSPLPINLLGKFAFKKPRTAPQSAVKEIIGLPIDSPDSMLYSSRKVRGLGIMKASWEAFLQHINVCNLLDSIDDPLLATTRNFAQEIRASIQHLGFPSEEQPNVRNIQKKLRNQQFEEWKKLNHRGKGVSHFSEWSKSNYWISTKKGLSTSQWTNAIKMNCNVIAKSGKFDVYEEVHCISSTGSTKRADIIAIDNSQKIGFIIDPTIRFEGAEFQPQEVDLEKKRHYEPCFPYLEEKYRIPVCRWEVIGLLFGNTGIFSDYSGSPVIAQ
ncbi:hypothetical protein ANN_08536 [Periplaneta americana]|uniref:Uncharacterized protein n=1 Tax=Periplaneta americana TaxID=6978 RepID=A0ABQ8T1N9_PERAM|nr:hypothetical protein ANN_08536 [Periplaneta americana]